MIRTRKVIDVKLIEEKLEDGYKRADIKIPRAGNPHSRNENMQMSHFLQTGMAVTARRDLIKCC